MPVLLSGSERSRTDAWLFGTEFENALARIGAFAGIDVIGVVPLRVHFSPICARVFLFHTSMPLLDIADDVFFKPAP